MKSGNLNSLEPSGPLQACNGTDFFFFYLIWENLYTPVTTHTRNIRLKINIITAARFLKESDTLRKTGRTPIWGSHRPQHGVANVKSLVANDKNGFKILTLKGQSESSKVNR